MSSPPLGSLFAILGYILLFVKINGIDELLTLLVMGVVMCPFIFVLGGQSPSTLRGDKMSNFPLFAALGLGQWMKHQYNHLWVEVVQSTYNGVTQGFS